MTSRSISGLKRTLLGKAFAAAAVAYFLVCHLYVEAQSGHRATQPTSAAPSPTAVTSLEEGNRAMRAGDHEAAIAAFRQVVSLSPRFAEGFLNLAVAEERAGHPDKAKEALGKALKLKATLRGVNFLLGISTYQLNDFDAAQAAFARETRIDPGDAAAWMWTGVAALAAGRNDQAVAPLTRAKQIDPRNIDTLYHLGRAYLLLSKDSYGEMYHLDPDSARVHETLAQADVQAGKSGDAIAEYTRAITKSPTQPGVREELADELWRAMKLDDADHEYGEALRITPGDPVILFKRGSLEVSRGNTADAANGVSLLQKALELDPTLNEVYYNLGTGQAFLKLDEDAIRNLTRATERDPDGENRQSSFYRLFQIYRRLGRHQEADTALASFQRVKEENSRKQRQLFEEKRRRTTLPVPQIAPDRQPEEQQEHLPGQ